MIQQMSRIPNILRSLHLENKEELYSKQNPKQGVDFIYLFGSSLDITCHVNSDIDLYVISEEDAERTVLFDEAFTAIDDAQKFALITKIRAVLHGRTVLAVTHNIDEAKLFADSIMFFDKNMQILTSG